MRKTIYIVAIIALFTLSIAPVLAAVNVNTGLTADTSGGANPIVKAKWEANYISSTNRYTDASSDAGAQLLPSGVKDVSKVVSICAVVTDPDGLADVLNVYADVFYPKNIALGPDHTPLPDQSGQGCGLFMQEDSLAKLTKTAGIELFCNKVRNSNNNLPTFNTGYNYDEICGETGELQKDTAAVYCGQKNLSYEDPAGDYEIWAIAQDQNGKQGKLINNLTYLPLTAFETDFTQVSYGSVRLNTHKIIAGDLTWDALNQGRATVRNVGNTRLTMQVWQNDMGLGKTDGLWNVKYDARVGSFSTYAVYFPEVTTALGDELNLSELDEMDFSIDISKFPPTHPDVGYTGTMTLSAVSAPHLTCVE
ncbi:MAG: hypothetical protein Q7K65_03745 [Candidatus Buchananbacteria bacterium]|nr:hypothetical protein [Candidatus Buchananbacteria bacterium]